MLAFTNASKEKTHAKEKTAGKRCLCLALSIGLSLALLAGCNNAEDDPAIQNTARQTEQTATENPAATQDTGEAVFSYSEGIDANGFWTGVRALDHIDMFDYKGMSIPSEVHQVADADIQAEIDYILSSYSSSAEVTDRAVANGDTVNIDYVGRVDGVSFDGGSTGGVGTEVVAGSTNYIDDFLTQIIGHMPGETMDVVVTFPEDYYEESLQGKDAVFETTINFIISAVSPELTDAFVSENLSADYGWTTVSELTTEIENNLQKNALAGFIMDHFVLNVTANSIPDSIMDYQVKIMLDYYQSYADAYGVGLDEFLNTYVGVSGMDELIESNQADNQNSAKYALVAQAVAEDAGFTVSTEDLVAFFTENMGTSDYSSYEAEYGLPYLAQVVLQRKVIDLVIANAILL